MLRRGERPFRACVYVTARRLLVAVGNPAFRQVVGGEFHCHAIASEYANTIASEFAGKVGENGSVGIQLNTK